MKKVSVNSWLLIAFLVMTLTGCRHQTGEPGMYPDYRDVTLPCNIAPANFHYTGTGAEKAVTLFTAGSLTIRIKGESVCLKPQQWNALKEQADGGAIHVESSLTGSWDMFISKDTIDPYLTYRLIEPGYEVWNKVEIRERNITSFEERTLATHANTENSCMNCHIHKGANTMFYLRGPKGGAVLNRNGQLRKLTLNREGLISGTVYGDLHPSGRWGVFSTNIIIPGFHSVGTNRLEVYDTVSDLCITDFDNNKILTSPEFTRADKLETFPCFSADGTNVYFCSADTVKLPEDIEDLKYSLLSANFNPETGEMGEKTTTLWDGPEHNASVCHPKASPDGRWIVFTVADYGTFPIWHRECDLWIMNLDTGESHPMDKVNSPNFSDTYHSWSANSRWIVFASKRDDGQYGKPYICHISADGTQTKPFLLPQQDPTHYETTLKSYNIPDLGAYPAPYTSEDVAALRKGNGDGPSFPPLR